MRLFLEIRAPKCRRDWDTTRYSICEITSTNKVRVIFRSDSREELRIRMDLLGMKFRVNSDDIYFGGSEGRRHCTIYFWVEP